MLEPPQCVLKLVASSGRLVSKTRQGKHGQRSTVFSNVDIANSNRALRKRATPASSMHAARRVFEFTSCCIAMPSLASPGLDSSRSSTIPHPD
ncbi:hypothetical protein SISNIDRAFT_363981 [Sistotremastrum niveocremeum HHB9708]|uniref:Uncharacterized protein n=1 Tax=Sistotremastrum niveocremeum HHB9708 TaxID=1314777 RepID=A0A164MA76_9AGAM|nr:hypothetical protein SISNIDRAFT_363981 [Sistotremastrum niveocremeum HHB9708]